MVEPTPLNKYARQNGFIFSKVRVEYKKYLSCHHLELIFNYQSIHLVTSIYPTVAPRKSLPPGNKAWYIPLPLATQNTRLCTARSSVAWRKSWGGKNRLLEAAVYTASGEKWEGKPASIHPIGSMYGIFTYIW